MADKKDDSQGGDTDDLKKENQTVTREQFNEMEKRNVESQALLKESLTEFEKLKKSQSGADAKVTELQKQIKQQKDEGKSAEEKLLQDFGEKLESIEKERDSEKVEKQQAILKGLAIQLLSEKKISAPKYLDRLIGKDAKETEANIMQYIEERLELELSIADEFAKNNGRRIQTADRKGDMKTLDDFTDDEIRKMSNAEFLKIQGRSKKK